MKKEKKQLIERKRSSGFTFTEILVYIAVFSLLTISISSFVLWSVHSNARAKAMRIVTQDGRRIMTIMEKEIREAESVYTPTTGPQQLSLVTNNYLPDGEDSTFIDFYLQDGRICLKKESQNPIAITSESVEIKNLSFTKVGSEDNPSVEISLLVDYKNPGSALEYNASLNLLSTVTLRTY